MAMPSATQPAEQLEELRLRTNIDATSRLVEQQDARRVSRTRASTTFCWLPPDSEATGASTPAVRIRKRSIARCALAQLLTTPGDASGAPGAEGDVRPDRSAEGQTLTVAVLGHERHAGVERLRTEPTARACPVDLDPSADSACGRRRPSRAARCARIPPGRRGRRSPRGDLESRRYRGTGHDQLRGAPGRHLPRDVALVEEARPDRARPSPGRARRRSASAPASSQRAGRHAEPRRGLSARGSRAGDG